MRYAISTDCACFTGNLAAVICPERFYGRQSICVVENSDESSTFVSPEFHGLLELVSDGSTEQLIPGRVQNMFRTLHLRRTVQPEPRVTRP
jgi:hypothetical protein